MLEKIKKIKDELPENTSVAECVFKNLIKKIKNNFQLRETTIREVYETIRKSEPSKGRCNEELNMYILKQIISL